MSISHSVYALVATERTRAHEKHKAKGSRELTHWFDRSWGDVLGEEVGEVHKEFNEYWLGNIDYNQLRDNVRQELIQVAAMATAWIDAIAREESP